MSKYDKMTQENFDRILIEILDEWTGSQLLTFPGVYELLSEEFNNEVLNRWELEQRPDEDENDDCDEEDEIERATDCPAYPCEACNSRFRCPLSELREENR